MSFALARVSLGGAVTLALLAPSSVVAQAVDERCGQTEDEAVYGALAVGVRVVPQRHRYVGLDPNWDPEMGAFIGLATEVTRLSGVDESGCPGVRLAIDGERYFWRARDLDLEGAPTRALTERSLLDERLPQACGMREDAVSFGPLEIGTAVVLGRHRAVDGEDNWTEEMAPFVGRTAHVLELPGVDDEGCPGVHVDGDRGRFFWRVRDLRLAGEHGWPSGVASDHGRHEPAEASPASEVAEGCAQLPFAVDFGEVEESRRVRLGRHRAVDGDDNWTPTMNGYVGREARVTELAGLDEQGCAVVRVDLDDGAHAWRVRDLEALPTAE